MGGLTILLNKEVKLPRYITDYYKVKNLWQKTRFLWDPSKLEKLVTNNEPLIRVPWNVNVLLWLLEHSEQITDKGKGKNIVFEGTILLDKEDYAHFALFWDIKQSCWTKYVHHEVTYDQQVRRPYKRGDVGYETAQKDKPKSRVLNFVKLERVF